MGNNDPGACYRRSQEGRVSIVVYGCSSFYLQPFICALWSISRLFVKASSGRNRINVLGVVNAITKEVLTLNNTTYINADTIITFLNQLRVYYGASPLKIVLDNARYQHCKLVEQVARSLNITLLFLHPILRT